MDILHFDPDSLLIRPSVFTKPVRTAPPLSWIAHVPFAFWIVDALRPERLVELGTHSGNSYSAFAQAVAAAGLPTACYAVDTWQGDDHAGFYAEDVFAEWKAFHDHHFGRFSTLIRGTFDEALERFADGAIDLLHIDGLHTYDAARHDFDSWLPKMSPRGVVLLHDTNVHLEGYEVWRLWDELAERFPTFAFLHGFGLGVVGVGADVPPDIAWLLSPNGASARLAMVRQFFAALGEARTVEAEAVAQEATLADTTARLDAATAESERCRADRDRLQAVAVRLRARLPSADGASYAAQTADNLSVMRESGLFDAAFYLERYPDVSEAGLDPLAHFDQFGWREGRKPNAIFDPAWYLRTYPDVGAEDVNPLVHYARSGWREGRDPAPTFSTAGHLAAHPDIAEAGEEPLAHYLRHQ